MSQPGEAARQYQEALKIYRRLAEERPAAFLPDVAATLVNLGVLARNQDRPEKARKAFEEALEIYTFCAKQDPEKFSELGEQVRTLLKQLRNE